MNAKKRETTSAAAAPSLTGSEREMARAASELAETGIPASEQPGVGAKRAPSRLLLILAAMGPGIITAMAGNDAGGISTYSTAGANFGFGTLWVIPIMCVLLIVVETTAGRMGAVTGKGFAALIRERFGIRLAAFAMLALLIGNVATTFSEFAGIASGMEMFGVSKYISVPVAALAVWLLVVGGSYKRVQNVFLALSLVFITYIVAAFLAQPNWAEAAHDTVVPTVVGDVGFISLVIAMIGTTIAPWMMFFTQSNVVEKGLTTKDLFSQRVDAVSGTIAACIVAWFIIVTTGAVLFPAGISIDSAADAAAALAPFAGPYAEALFAVGLIAASFLAACVLPLTTAFVICEAFGWEAGVSFKWREAPTFKSIFTFVIAFSAIVVLLPDVNLLAMMLTAQFVNGVILPILLAFMAIISADKRIMGAYRSRRVSKVLLWATVGVVAILTAVLLVMQVMGLA
ncbi:metal ion (Mn2+/Fe2+) transporter (Nramp) family metal ion transporter [Adlercreutzia caecimuris B7]|uniref:Metal ion (Mn2+/Fe2+) transporter (Nramp) family metal ion transporter n=2 Tax=Adlercreutzia caecimuris TaxID=671266 RepID=R9KU10_9ACTN|nr:divalent metal cation transporter [Adlercreutzia caecimuris]EOS50049.1 metal ion (Mn2+/Fe2+) transporter (Nramp) family metal ion transporter [Adlercreutzia caecimuris B7]